MNLGFVILVLVVYFLAAARIVRFVNADTLMDSIRIAIERRAQDPERSRPEQDRWSTLGEFASCPWCVSIWVCAGTVWLPMFHADNRVVQYVAVVLAVSHLIGACARFVQGDEIEFEPK